MQAKQQAKKQNKNQVPGKVKKQPSAAEKQRVQKKMPSSARKMTLGMRLKKEYNELAEELKKAGLNMPKETWFKIGYGVFTAYIIALAYRYYYAFNWLNPIVITNDIIILLVCSMAPIALWMFSTNYERWRFHNRKKFWLYTAIASGVATLEQPLTMICHLYLVSRVMKIPVTENMTEGMVVLLARLCLVIPYILLNAIIVPPISKTLKSLEVQEKIEDFTITDTVDLRKNKNHLYDLNIIKDLKTGKVRNIKQNDRLVHTFINGQTGTGKTSSTIIPAVAEDLNTKLRNIEAREYALLELLRQRKAYIAGPFAHVTEHNIRPAKGYEAEYKEIYDKYPDCGITVMAPNNSMNQTIIELCEARGFPVNVIDPSKEYKGKIAKSKGIANFHIPDGLPEEKEIVRIIEQAENFSEVIVATNERSGEGEQYFRDINTSITTNIAIVCILSNRIRGKETTFNEVKACVHDFRKLDDKVKIIEDFYGFHIDSKVVEKTKGSYDTDDLKNKLKKNEARIDTKANDESNPFYNIIVDVKKDLLGPGAEKMEDQTRGLRNILAKISVDPRFNRIFSTPIENSIDFDEMLSKNQITVINTALEYGAPKSSALGIMILLNFTSAVLRRPADKRSFHFLWVDESSQYLHRVYEDMIELFRQYGVAVGLAMQSTAQMDKYRTTSYLKGVILGVGTQILFGRVSAEEMRLYEQLAGEKLSEDIQKTISQTSYFTDNPNQNEAERMVKERKKVVTGRDIRNRNFQEVTVFKIDNNKVKDAFLGKCSFLNSKKELKPQQIRHVNFAAFVPKDRIKKEMQLTKSAEKMVKKQSDFIEKKKENIQILSLDTQKPMLQTGVEDTKDLDQLIKETIKEEQKRQKLQEKQSSFKKELEILEETASVQQGAQDAEASGLSETELIKADLEKVEQELESMTAVESIFGNLFEEEEEEYVDMNVVEQEIEALMEYKKRNEEE